MSLSSDLAAVFAKMKTLNNKPAGWEPPIDEEGNILPIEDWDQDSWPIVLEDGDQVLADEIAAAVVKCVESGKTAGSVYNGSCSLGASSGTVLGTFTSIDASAGKSDGVDALYGACTDMSNAGENASNDDLWNGYVDCCSAIVTQTVIKESCTGTVVPPSTPPPTVPASGNAEGELVDSAGKAALLTALKLIPTAMGSTGDDSIMANAMATATLTYLAAVVVNLSASGTLSGLSATNALVGNS